MPQRGAGCSPGTCRGAGRCPTRGQWLERQPPRDQNEDEDILNFDTRSVTSWRKQVVDRRRTSTEQSTFDDPPTVNGSPTVDTTSAGDQVPPDENPGHAGLLLLAETNRKRRRPHRLPRRERVRPRTAAHRRRIRPDICEALQSEPRQSHNVKRLQGSPQETSHTNCSLDAKAEAKWATRLGQKRKTDVAAALRLTRQRDNHEAELRRRQELADRHGRKNKRTRAGGRKYRRTLRNPPSSQVSAFLHRGRLFDEGTMVDPTSRASNVPVWSPASVRGSVLLDLSTGFGAAQYAGRRDLTNAVSVKYFAHVLVHLFFTIVANKELRRSQRKRTNSSSALATAFPVARRTGFSSIQRVNKSWKTMRYLFWLLLAGNSIKSHAMTDHGLSITRLPMRP
ncbi:unnamed protein product [Trichogramma brassicae]|uniref:Uncharacterized protein n=1 Tax=Trichogramma brassicae TaxID=86971 RepID=A0A6H5I709_9HYME|nr:unnamed protein product [Trichogramma brassicae]